jgi:hypothetical protein
MKMDHDFVQQMLVEAGLARKKLIKQSYIIYADCNAWDSLIAKYILNIETTYFTINKKRQMYIKAGSWCSTKHSARTPGYIWKESLQACSYDVPKLQISSVAINLAKSVGRHISPTAHVTSAASKPDQSISSESSTSVSGDDEEEMSSEDNNTVAHHFNLNREEYPFLHHHRLNIHGESAHNKVVHELLKSCGGNSFFYRQLSGYKSALIRIPSAGTSAQYHKMVKKKGNFLEHILLFMDASLKKSSETGHSSEAAACIIQYLFDNYEEEFRAVAAENNVALKSTKKMEPSKVEAMLHEAGIGKSNSRVLFRHLNQFFGTSMFALEKVRCKCFSGEEFQPAVDIHEL